MTSGLKNRQWAAQAMSTVMLSWPEPSRFPKGEKATRVANGSHADRAVMDAKLPQRADGTLPAMSAAMTTRLWGES